jgi:hypothetical protein
MISGRRLCLTLAAAGSIVLSSAGLLDGAFIARALAAAPRAATHVCPMHADVRAASPGTCPRCGMALVPLKPGSGRDYRLDVETSSEPSVGRPIRLTLTVRDPETKAVVRDFAVVHEKRFHLFVLSQDLNHYDHMHPEQQPDGSFALDITLPQAGAYKLFADFQPEGGTPQVIPHAFATRGFPGDVTASTARLVPDSVLKNTAGTMSVQLALPDGGLVAGREERFAYQVTDARTGRPVRDIEPYLGAWGHSLIMSEDLEHDVHAHPLEAGTDQPGAQGGPILTFKAILPRPGRYRIWTQIKRGGVVSTAIFTVSAVQNPSH